MRQRSVLLGLVIVSIVGAVFLAMATELIDLWPSAEPSRQPELSRSGFPPSGPGTADTPLEEDAPPIVERQQGTPAEFAQRALVQDGLPLFYRYEVQRGDTVSSVAARFGIDEQYILWNNHDLTLDRELTVGAKLIVPAIEGVLHTVEAGESLDGIAAQYGARAADIIGFPANGLARSDLLSVGSTILVPAGR